MDLGAHGADPGAAGCGRRRAAGANSEALGAPLRAPCDLEKLVLDVADMRRRIAEENPRPGPWDLKNRRGGLTDIEFIVQYLQLRYAASFPSVLRRDTAQVIEELGAAGALPSQAVRELGAAVMLLRNVHAVLTLLIDGSPASAALADDAGAATLARCVGAVDFAQLDADITKNTARVRDWYDRLVEQPARRASATGDSKR